MTNKHIILCNVSWRVTALYSFIFLLFVYFLLSNIWHLFFLLFLYFFVRVIDSCGMAQLLHYEHEMRSPPHQLWLWHTDSSQNSPYHAKPLQHLFRGLLPRETERRVHSPISRWCGTTGTMSWLEPKWSGFGDFAFETLRDAWHFEMYMLL